jgi:hypothetical protein
MIFRYIECTHLSRDASSIIHVWVLGRDECTEMRFENVIFKKTVKCLAKLHI